MSCSKDLSNKKFDFLTVISLHHIEDVPDPNRNRTVKVKYWLCKCDCGNEVIRRGSTLTNNKTHSCGCKISYKATLEREKRLKKHPHYKEIHAKWSRIKERLYNPNSIGYKNYGGRGIVMCEEWKSNSFEFYKWAINNGWKEGLTIDRIDNEGNYCPENCRWVDMKTQNRNTRRNIYITYNGETKCMAEWAYALGVCHKVFWNYAKTHNKDYLKTIEYYKNKISY